MGLLVGLLLAWNPARAAAPEYAYRPGEVLIKFKPGTLQAEQERILGDLGATRITSFSQIGASHERITRLSVDEAIARYRDDRRVQYIEPNYVVRAFATPNDPLFPQLWGLDNTGQTGGTPGADIHAKLAWGAFTGSSSVLVGIIDSGMDYNHPDLAANVFVNPGETPGNGIDDDGNGFIDDVHGWDFVNNDNDPFDDLGHGTHVAGTIGAVGNNGLGVVGVNWTVRLMPIKFLDSAGFGTDATAIGAIQYATKMGVRLTNNSWGGGGYSQAMFDAILAASDAGILFVAAAGNLANDNDLTPNYPSGFDLPNIIAVAATDPFDELAFFSSYGATTVDLAAPGTGILSTWLGGGYDVLSGTSMSTPHVSGALALIFGRFTSIDATSARNLLLSRVDPVPGLTGKVATGGRLNAFLPIAEPDDTPPLPIADLAVAEANGDWVQLQWTATGDDGAVGQATRYDVRHSTAPITAENFGAATRATGAPAPLPAGTVQTMRVSKLEFSTPYYFALQAFDELGNPSGISNVAAATTLGPPDVAVDPAALAASLLTGGTATRTLTISNTGVSDLSYELRIQPPPGAGPLVPVPAAVRSPAPASVGPAGSGSPGRSYSEGRQPMRTAALPLAKPGTFRQAATGFRILILQSGAQVNEIHSVLASFPDIAQVDDFDGSFATPSLDFLRTYHAVIAVDNVPFASPDAIGDVLADYVDGGGGLVLTLATFIGGWDIRGRLQSGGYLPFDIGTGPQGAASLGTFDATHPIMRGVAAAGGDLLGQVTVAQGAQLVASWSNGLPFVATQGAHVAALNVFFGRPGFWTGDVGVIAHNAALWSSGIPTFVAADPGLGVIPPGSSAQIQVTFDASHLFGGDYHASVAVRSNDPDEPEVLVPADLHVTGAPDVAARPGSLEFGTVFIGGSRPDTLTVSNQGSDVLSISGVSTSPGEFAAPGEGFDLAPGQRRDLIVTFAPQSETESSGTLIISSNDPDHPQLTVALHGEGQIAPDIAVAPDSLSVSLAAGTGTMRTVTVRNTGGSDLTFTVAGEGLPPTSAPRGVGSRRDQVRPAGAAPVALRAPPLAAWPAAGAGGGSGHPGTASPGLAARARPAFPPNAATIDNEILVLSTTPIAGSIERALDELGKGYDLAFTEDFTNVEYAPYPIIIVAMDGGRIEPSSCQALANAAAGGRLVFMLGGTTYAPFYTGVQNYLLAHTGQTGWTTSPPPHLTVANPADPLVQGLPQTHDFADPNASFYMLRIDDPAATIALVNGANHPALVRKVIGSGDLVYFIDSPVEFYWGNPTDFAILKQIVHNTLAAGPLSWLSIDPRAGTLHPGEQMDLQVGFDATGLLGGDYRARLRITSNDPDESPLDVGTHLHVIGTPDISVSKPELDFGAVMIGLSRRDSLVVSNLGSDLLTVTGVTSSPGDFQVAGDGFVLAPGQSKILFVTFAPAGAGPIQGQLTIQSDDPDEAQIVVGLGGAGLVPPQIQVAPASLSAGLFSGGGAERALEIANPGGSTLTYSISLGSPPAPARAAAASAGPRRDGAGQVGPQGPSRLGALLRRRLRALAPQSTAFYDDMEHGDNGWTRLVIGPEDLWHRTTRASNSPATSWWCGVEGTGNYSTGKAIRTAMVSPPISLKLYSAPVTLEFFESFNTEPDYDFCMVDVSSDGGTTWTPLRGGLGQAPSGDSGGWRLTMLDLSGWAGQVIRIRFYFDTVDQVTNNYPGWYFDDVLVSAAGVPWLTVSPPSGSVAAGGTQDLAARLDATGMPGGDYGAEIRIATNVPNQPQVTVPVQLHVTSAPDADLSASAVDFGQVYAGATGRDTVVITNGGVEPLSVTAVTATPAPFGAPADPFELSPGESRPIPLTFVPPAPGLVEGALRIESNDPDSAVVVVPLRGEGVLAPDIAVTPDSLSADLLSGEQSTLPLTVANRGGVPLLWSASLHPAGSAVSPSRTASAATAGPRPDGEGLTGPRGASRFGSTLRRRLGLLPAQAEVFYDDMEHGDNGWTHVVFAVPSPPIPTGDLWHRTTRASNSPLTSWWCGIDTTGNYATGNAVRTAAVSPSIDLSSFNAPIALEFYENFQTEPGFDFCMVDLSTDGGTSWTPLRGGPGQAPSGNSGGWRLTIIDLSAWAGQVIKIRFYFDTGDPASNAFPGWFFDDVLVSASGVPWLTVAPPSGSVAGAGTQELAARLDATGLPGGDYGAEIRIASNDPDQPEVKVPVHLRVIGAPDIDVSASAVDFGEVYIGSTNRDTLVVANGGNEPLTVSGVDVVNAAAFGVPTAGFTIPAGGVRTLAVTYAPTGTGVADGSLTIHSNDPNEGDVIVTLHGEAVEPPHVAISPALLDVTVPIDEVRGETMTLTNAGGSPLSWSIDLTYSLVDVALVTHQAAVTPGAPPAAPNGFSSATPPRPIGEPVARWDPPARSGVGVNASAGVRAASRRAAGAAGTAGAAGALTADPPLSDVLAMLDFRHSIITAAIPSRFDFVEGEAGVSILDGGQDMYDDGNFLRTDQGGPIAYSNDSIQFSPVLGTGSGYFTRKYPGLFVMVADLNQIHRFMIQGDLGANGAGAVDGAVLEADGLGIHYRGYVKRVFGAGDASVNHLIILPDPGESGHSFSLDTNSDFDEVSNLVNLERIYYLLFAGDGGAYIDDQAMLGILQAFLSTLAPLPKWMNVNPLSGVVPAHGTSDLTVHFEPADLALGSYYGHLRVHSNDPDQPMVDVNVSMVVSESTPVEVSLVSSSGEPGVARVTWYAPLSATESAVVYRRADGGDWTLVRSIAPDGRGYLVFEDHDVVSGSRYGYRLGIRDEGSEWFAAEVWVDVPSGVSLSLRGMEPNPAKLDLRVAFSLPDAHPATVELIDLAGRRLRSVDVGSRGAGTHVVSLGRTGSIPAGVYMVRLLHDDQALVVKGVVTP